jgi:hypothetical protein
LNPNSLINSSSYSHLILFRFGNYNIAHNNDNNHQILRKIVDPKTETAKILVETSAEVNSTKEKLPVRPDIDSWNPKENLDSEASNHAQTNEDDLYFPDFENPKSIPELKPPFDAKIDGPKLQELAGDINRFRNQPDRTTELYREAGDIVRRAFANGKLSELGVEFDRAYDEKQMHFAKTGKYAPGHILNFSQALTLAKDEILKNPNLFVTAEDLKPLEAEAQVRADEMSEKIAEARTTARNPKLN